MKARERERERREKERREKEGRKKGEEREKTVYRLFHKSNSTEKRKL
jgi:hypothetical protein